MLLNVLADGISYAGWLFLVSIGLTLVFGVLRVVNVAHGGIYAVGAYAGVFSLGFLLRHGAGVPLQLLGMAVAAIAAGVILGVLLERGVIAPLRAQDEVLALLATYGALLILTDGTKYFFGGASRYANEPREQLGSVGVAGLQYPVYDILLVAFAVFVGLAVWLTLSRTRVGRLVSAVATDPQISLAMGVNVKRFLAGTFIAGTVLGTLAGAFTAPKIAVLPSIGPEVIVLAFAVVVVGGLGNIGGAALGALIIGFCKALSVHFFPAADLFVIYAVMAVVLAFRPFGLFAQAQARRV